MHVLLVGGGGREHALAWRLSQSPVLSRLSVTHANPGFPDDATVAVGDPVAWSADNGVDLVVVGPEAPLADGIADRLMALGISCFGPSQAAAQLEASKAFAKRFMDRHGIPTAEWSVHNDLASALAAIDGPCVVKADGLAAGKGVVVALDADVARAAVTEIFSGRFGSAGSRVVIEELLAGPEVSVLALCDGQRAMPLLPCRDHKARLEGGEGPNTGGMGAICPAPGVSDDVLRFIHTDVLQRTVDGMRADGAPFRGVLYAGLMLTPKGPRLLEFNARFGDPECQPLMMMMDEDLLPLLKAAADGDLPKRSVRWRGGATCCVVMVSGPYPGAVPRGMPIHGVPAPSADLTVFFAGARRVDDQIVADGGRVLGVTAHGETLSAARGAAYGAVGAVSFQHAAWRTDIGAERRTR